MKTNRDKPTDAADPSKGRVGSPRAGSGKDLRRRAEDILQNRPPPVDTLPPVHETQRLLHELQVRQIELEMQNEELRESQANLEAAVANYTDLYDFASVGYFTLDRAGAILRVNLAGARLLDIERAKLPGKNLGTFVAKTDHPAFSAFMEKVFASQEKEGCEIELARTGLLPQTVRMEATLSSNEQECHAVLIDMTERKKEEKALRETTMMLESSIKSSPMAIIVVDNDDKVRVWNPAAEHMFGWSEQEVIGQTLPTIPDHKKEEFNKIREVMERKEVIRMERTRRKKKDDSLFDVSLSVAPMINADGNVIGRMGIFSDITEHLLAEKKIYESEKLYRAIFENTGTATIIILEDRTIFMVNAEFEKLSGYTKDEVENKKKWTDFIVKEDLKKMLTQEGLRRNNPDAALRSYDFRFINKAGETKDILLFADSINGTKKTVASLMDITDRKQAEMAIVHKQAMLERTENIAHVGSWEWEIATDTVKWSDELFHIFQRDPARGTPSFAEHPDLYYPEDMSKLRIAVEDAVSKGTPYELDMQAIRADGEVRMCVARGIAETGPDGRVLHLYGSLQDITERRQAEEALRVSEQKYRFVLENAGEAIFIAQDRMLKYVNPATVVLLDYAEEVLLSKPFTEFIHPEDRSMVLERYMKRVSGEDVTERYYYFRIETGAGTVKWVEIHASMIEWEGRPATINFLSDITKRREAEARLKESEERYRSIFENAQEGIYRTTPEGKIIMANQAMAKMYGYDSPQEIMAAITDVTRQLYVHPEEREKIKGIIETHGSIRNHEAHHYRRDGSTFWLSVTMQAVRDETGRILYYEGITENITDRKESFEQLRKTLLATVQAMSMIVETRDPYTAGHQRRVADLARAIATEMGLTADQINSLRMAGIIHDLGKISVPAEILSKPTKLTNIEFSIIKTHAQSGYDILKDIEFPGPIARMVLEHHERMDGSGYPNGVTGDKLLLESRILAVADVVEAMASHRPYRPALGLDAALDEIIKSKGKLYDPEVADACLRLFNEKDYKIIN